METDSGAAGAEGQELEVADDIEASSYFALTVLNNGVTLRLADPNPQIPARCNLFAVSNVYGLAVWVTSRGFALAKTADLRQLYISTAQRTLANVTPLRTVEAGQGSLHVLRFASADTLLVATGPALQGGIGLWQLKGLVDGSQTSPVHIFPPSGSSPIVDLLPNPSDKPELLAALSGDGHMTMYNLITLSATAQFGSGLTSACWSVKGKQIVCGDSTGTLTQYTPEGKAAASVPPPPSQAGRVPLDIRWVENLVFFVTYQDPENTMVTDVFILSREKKDGPVAYQPILDPLMVENADRPEARWSVWLRGWHPFKHLLLVGNSTSNTIGHIGQAPTEEGGSHVVWSQIKNDLYTTLPLDSATTSLELDCTATEPLALSENSPNTPLPVLWAYDTSGTLSAWIVANKLGPIYPGIQPAVDILNQAPIGSSLMQQSDSVQSMPSVTTPPRPAPAFASPAPGGSPFSFSSSLNTASALGSKGLFAPAFGQSAFGQPAAPAFGQSAFGQPAFGKPTASPATTPTANPFGKSSSTTSGFASFGKSGGQSGFATPASVDSPFASRSTSPAATPAFASAAPSTFASAGFGGAAASTPAFGQPSAASPFGASIAGTPKDEPLKSIFGKAATSATTFGTTTFGSNTPSSTASPAASDFSFGNKTFGAAAEPSASGFGGLRESNGTGFTGGDKPTKPPGLDDEDAERLEPVKISNGTGFEESDSESSSKKADNASSLPSMAGFGFGMPAVQPDSTRSTSPFGNFSSNKATPAASSLVSTSAATGPSQFSFAGTSKSPDISASAFAKPSMSPAAEESKKSAFTFTSSDSSKVSDNKAAAPSAPSPFAVKQTDSTSLAKPTVSPAFGAPTAFGQTSAFGQSASPFSKHAATAAPTTTAFAGFASSSGSGSGFASFASPSGSTSASPFASSTAQSPMSNPPKPAATFGQAGFFGSFASKKDERETKSEPQTVLDQKADNEEKAELDTTANSASEHEDSTDEYEIVESSEMLEQSNVNDTKEAVTEDEKSDESAEISDSHTSGVRESSGQSQDQTVDEAGDQVVDDAATASGVDSTTVSEPDSPTLAAKHPRPTLLGQLSQKQESLQPAVQPKESNGCREPSKPAFSFAPHKAPTSDNQSHFASSSPTVASPQEDKAYVDTLPMSSRDAVATPKGGEALTASDGKIEPPREALSPPDGRPNLVKSEFTPAPSSAQPTFSFSSSSPGASDSQPKPFGFANFQKTAPRTSSPLASMSYAPPASPSKSDLSALSSTSGPDVTQDSFSGLPPDTPTGNKEARQSAFGIKPSQTSTSSQPALLAPQPQQPPARPVSPHRVPSSSSNASYTSSVSNVPPKLSSSPTKGAAAQSNRPNGVNLFVDMHEQLLELKSSSRSCMEFVQAVRRPNLPDLGSNDSTEAFDPLDVIEDEWSMGDLPRLAEVARLLTQGMEEVTLSAESSEKSAKEFEGALLRTKAKVEEIARYVRAREDPTLARLIRIRQLGPEQQANQARIRSAHQAVESALVSAESALSRLHSQVLDRKMGRSPMKAPSIDTIHRAMRNITRALEVRRAELDDLQLRLDMVYLSTSRHNTPKAERHRKIQANGSPEDSGRVSRDASPNKSFDASFRGDDAKTGNGQQGIQRAQKVSSEVERRVQRMLDAEVFGQELKKSFAAAGRTTPLFSTVEVAP